MINKKIALFLLSWLCVLGASAQTVDAIILPPPQTAYISDFFSNPNLFRVIVTNKTAQPIEAKIGGKLIYDGTTLGSSDIANSDVFTLNPGANFFNGEDVFQQFLRGRVTVDTANKSLQELFFAGQWPSGVYEWCIEIQHATTRVELLPNKCVRRFVTAYQVPILLTPREGQVLNNPGTVLFRWTPITPAYKEGIVYYEVRVFDIKTGQTPMQAFQTNYPIIEKKVPSASLMVWPGEVPIENGRYVWTVRALDAQDRPICFPTQYAEPVEFSIIKGDPSSNTLGKAAFEPVFPGPGSKIQINDKAKKTSSIKNPPTEREEKMAFSSFFSEPESSITLHEQNKFRPFGIFNSLINWISPPADPIVVEADGEFLRFKVDLTELGASSTDLNNGLRVYMIEKKAGYNVKGALLQAIQSDRAFYKSPLLNINAQSTNIELSKILPDSMAGREFAWMIRAEVAGRTYDSDIYTFEYQAVHLQLKRQQLKFDCECKDTVCAPPIVADKSGVSTWKVGDTLLLGRYELRLTEWNNGDGKGIILLPYGKVGVKVGLSNIRANKNRQIFSGKANMEDSDFPSEIKNFGAWQPSAEQVTALNAHFSRMTGALQEGLTMPFSFKQHLDILKLRLPFDVVVTGMRFSPEDSDLDLAVLVENAPGQYVKFVAKKVPMAVNGFPLKNLRLYLAEDAVVNNFKLKASSDTASGSYIQFDCNGIKTFHLQTNIAVDPQHVQTLTEQPVTAAVTFDAADWGDFVATASVPAFQLTKASGIRFEGQEWFFDKSTLRNPVGFKLPNQPETSNAWQGLYTEGVTVKVSKDLLPSSTDLELKGKNIVYDSLGLTGQAMATDFAFGTKEGDWKIGVDSMNVQIEKSQLASMSFNGDLSLSYLFDYLPYKATVQRDSQQRMTYKITPQDDTEAALWKAKFKLAKTSEISLLPTQTKGDVSWQLAANLDADISFDFAESDIDTGYISVLRGLLGFSDFNFEIPNISIKGLKINHPDLPAGQKVGIQSVKTDKPFKLGGIDIDLVGIDIEDDTVTVDGEVRKARVMALHLAKDIDFDCKIWSLQSSTDTSSWDFSKLSFGLPIPKIVCETPEPIVINNQSEKPLSIGDKIQVGSFAMEVQKLASDNAQGVGVIRIPYLATSVAVNFDKSLKINDSDIAFSGAALADVNTTILPPNAFEPLVNGFRKLNLNLLNTSPIDEHISKLGKSANILPLSFKKLLKSFGSKLPFDVLITDLRFMSATPSMSLMMQVPVAGSFAQFEIPQLAFNERGFNLGDVKMQLANTLDLGNGLRLLRGPDSYAQLNCKGFETFGLSGDYLLDANQFATISNTGAPRATFKAKTTQFSNFIAQAEVEPMTIKALKGSELTVKNVILDRSMGENALNMALPKGLTSSIDTSNWRGLYAQEVTLKIPSFLPNSANSRLELSGSNVLVDSTGVTGWVTASNLTALNLGGLGMRLDTLRVGVDKSKIAKALLIGGVDVPVFGVSVPFEGSYEVGETEKPIFEIATTKDLDAKLWSAEFKIAKGSAVKLTKDAQGNWQRGANLNLEADMKINAQKLEEYVPASVLSALKSALGVNLLDFEFPKLVLNGFKIKYPGMPSGLDYSLDGFRSLGKVKLAGQEVDLRNVELVQQAVKTKDKTYEKGLGIVFTLSKGTDFELSTWIVPSAADSNKWEFAKLDLDFAFPKFECIEVAPVAVTASGTRPLAVGQTVDVSGFTMKVEQLASAAQQGIGSIRIPYLGTSVKVKFGNALQVNDLGKLYSGTILSQINESVLPVSGLLDKADGLQQVLVSELKTNALNELDNLTQSATDIMNGIRLPMSLKKGLGRFGSRLPFDVLLTNINFTGSESSMGLAMMIPYGSTGFARFSVPKLLLNNKGFNLADLEIGLTQNVELASGLYLRGTDVGGKTLGKLGCDGFKGLKLDGYYQLNDSQFGKIGGGQPQLNFTGDAKSLNDFIVEANADPLSIKALERSELTINRAVFDRSATENAAAIQFPKRYKGNTGTSWQGVYVQDFTLKLPSILPNQEDKMLTFKGKNLVIDTTGITTLAQATDIAAVNSGGFGLSIDTVTVDIAQSKLVDARLSGQVDLPLFSEPIRFSGTYGKDSTTGNPTYSLATTKETALNFWKASLKIQPNSGLELVKIGENTWERRASLNLEAKLDVTGKMLEDYVSSDILRGIESALGVNVLDFEIPTFKLKGLKINHLKSTGGRKYALDSYETAGKIKIAGQEVALTALDIVEDSVTVKGKSYKKAVGLVFQLFKGTDFELSTWAVPSEADTNKWVLGKLDLKFSIPKFECAPVAPLAVNNSGSQPLETNKSVKIGSFTMNIDQAPSGAQLGVGRIRIPYFGSTLRVNFDEKLRINADNEVYGGVVWSQVNPAILPATALLAEATSGLRNVNIAGLNINSLAQIATDNPQIGIPLPLSLKQSMGKFGKSLPFDVLVTHVNFTGTAPTMSLAMLVPAPNGNMAKFIVPRLPLSKKGFDLSNVQVQLAEDMALGNGFYLSGSETTAQTLANLNCNGFSDFKLSGYYELNPSLFSAVNSSAPAKAFFTAKAEGLSKFIATATVEPIRINALKGSELTISNAVLDRSEDENSPSVKFPKVYKGNKEASWQGLFVSDFSLKMPSFLPNQSGKPLSLTGKNMVFDSTGATALIEATNVLAISTSTEGGFGLSVDTLNMTMVQSEIDSAYLAGKIDIPFFSQAIPYNGVFETTDDAPYYSLTTPADATVNFWKASIGITKGSNVELFKNTANKWERRAKLNVEAELKINGSALGEFISADVLNAVKDATGANLLDFELPKFILKGFKINYPNLPAGKSFALDSFTYSGKLKLAGQEINLNGIELVQDTVTIKGIKYSKGVGLVFKMFKGVDFDFSIWSVPSSTDTSKWTFGKYDLNFGVPKFECVEPTPVVVSKTSPRLPKIGETVNLAGFSMKVDELAGAAGMGIGRIRIPYLGTTVKVNFGDNMSINAEGKVSAGFAFSQINSSLFPTNAIKSVTNGRAVEIAQMNLNALDQIIADNTPTGIALPLSLRKSMGNFGSKLPFDVLLTNINFDGALPNMSLAMLVPDRSGKMARFTVPKLALSPKGFSFSDLRFQLGQNFELTQGLFLNGSETEKKTSANFNCDGFVSLDLDGYYLLPAQQFKAITGTSTPRLTFKGNATSLSNFIAQATVEPMQIVGIDNSELRLTKATYDRSTTQNEAAMRFPVGYKGKTDASWNGIFVQEATLKMPSFLPNDGQSLTFSGKNIIVDSTGVSGMLEAANVLKVSTTDALGWGLSVDTLGVTMLQNKLDNAILRGVLNVPLFSESIKYAGQYKQDTTGTYYNLATTNDADLQFFGAKMSLLKGAEVSLEKTGTQWVRRAKMEVTAEFKVNLDSLTKYGGAAADLSKLMKDMGLTNLNFEFPKITFKGLKVNHKSLPVGKNYGVEAIEKSGDLKIAGQTVAIRGIDLIENMKETVINGKKFAKSLGLVFQLNKIVDTELAIWMVPDAKDATKWSFGKFEMLTSIPKFECVAVTPTTAPTGTSKALAVKDVVNVGDFKMTVTKAATGTTAAQLGEGEVRIPYMGTTVKVKFDNGFKVNTEGKAFGGIVTSDLSANFFPTGSFTNNTTVGNVINAAKMKFDKLTTLVATDIAIQMPMSLQQRLGRLGNQLPFDLLVTNVNLSPAKQSMSLAMLVPNVMGSTVSFSTDDLLLNGKGFGLSSLQLGLSSDIELAKGVFLNGGAGNALRTKAIFNCDGMESFSLAGRYQFPDANFVKPLSGTGNARFDFSGTGADLTNFIVEAKASPMQLSMLGGSELTLSRLSYDYSTKANAPSVKFPPQYGTTVSPTWRGFFAEEASLAIPSLLPNQSGKLKFVGKNVLLDSLGVSGTFQVQDVLNMKIDDLWQLKIDSFGVNVVKNALGPIQLAGEIGFPIIGASTRFDGAGVQSILNKDTTYTYTLAPKGELNMSAWRVNFALLDGSKLEFVRSQKSGVVTNTATAQLNAELSVDLTNNFIKDNVDPALVDILKSKLGVNVLDFAFPKFSIKNLKLNPKASQKISFDEIKPLGDLTLAGIKIDVVSTVVETGEVVTKNGKKLGTALIMNLKKGIGFKFRVWAVPDSKDTSKWTFGKLDLILDLPKFSCTNSTVAFTDKSAGSLTANKKVKVAGGFDMEVTQLASSGTPGKGKVTVPHFGTTYDVAFGTDLKINSKNEVIEGVVITLPNQEMFPAASIVKLPNGVSDLDLKKLEVTDALVTKLQNLNSVTKFPISMSSALSKMNEMLELPSVDIPLDITITGINFTPTGAQLSGLTTVETGGKYLRMGVAGLTIHQNGITFDKFKLFLVDNL